MRSGLLILAAAALLGACGPASEASTADAPQNAVQAAAAPAPGDAFPELTGRVVDTADLLTPEQEARLAGESERLEGRTTDQLVIATVPSLGGRGIEDFSRDLGNHWGVGQEDKDNGVLIVVAPSERKVRIEVGYGLEPILTNDRAAEIIARDLLPNFREERWFEGIDSGSRSIIATLIAREREPRQGRP